MSNVDRGTITPAQHLVVGRLAVGDRAIDDAAKRTVVSLMGRGLIEAARGTDGDLVFDGDWCVVYTLTERGMATVKARHLSV